MEAHNAIKKAISQSVGNLSPEFIELPSQNVFIFYPGSNNVIIPMGAEIFRNPAIKYRTSAAELARLAYNQVTVILYYSTFEIRKKFIEKGEYWQVTTAPAEKLVEENECYETARVCTRKGIKKFFGKYDINRPCWSEKISYECTSKPKAGCAHLTKQNCRLVDSECEHRIGNICLRWKRNFTCPITKKERNYSLADSSIYCLGGNCHTPTIEENQDFGNVAYLAAINEAQKDCDKESSGICKKPITAAEKRDILKRKAEEEERARRAKEEEKRLAEEARLKAQQEKVRLAEELRAREERKKFLEKERIRREQEQLRIAEENRIKREQALALHKQNELERLRQEKQAWYNNYIANMDAGRNPAHVTQRLWYQFFGITPQEYINNPNYTPNTAISRYGIDIVSPYQFIPRPFQE